MLPPLKRANCTCNFLYQRLQKKKKNSKGVSTPASEDIDQGEGGEKEEEEEEEASHSEMQDQVLMEDDSLEVKEEEEEATAEDEEVMDMGGYTCPYMYVCSVVC